MSEEQMNDSTFGRLFIIMIIAMIVLAVIIAVLASLAASDVNTRLGERSDRENTQAIAERIAPVGKFSAETAAAVPVVAAELTVEDLYVSCGACHASGVAGAPITGDAAAWTDRIAKGIDTLTAHAINGVNAMPARGGNAALSDQNIRDIVEYMVEESK